MIFFPGKTLKFLSFYKSAAVLSDNRTTIVILCRNLPAHALIRLHANFQERNTARCVLR